LRELVGDADDQARVLLIDSARAPEPGGVGAFVQHLLEALGDRLPAGAGGRLLLHRTASVTRCAQPAQQSSDQPFRYRQPACLQGKRRFPTSPSTDVETPAHIVSVRKKACSRGPLPLRGRARRTLLFHSENCSCCERRLAGASAGTAALYCPSR